MQAYLVWDSLGPFGVLKVTRTLELDLLLSLSFLSSLHHIVRVSRNVTGFKCFNETHVKEGNEGEALRNPDQARR